MYRTAKSHAAAEIALACQIPVEEAELEVERAVTAEPGTVRRAPRPAERAD
jgi:hypothetical protein